MFRIQKLVSIYLVAPEALEDYAAICFVARYFPGIACLLASSVESTRIAAQSKHLFA